MKSYFNLILLFSILCWGLMFSGCSDNKGDHIPDEGGLSEFVPIVLSRSEAEIVDRQNDFSFALFKKLVAGNENKNFMTSPLSASMAMSMLANGAKGETRDEILTTFGFGEEQLDDVNLFNRRLAKDLTDVDRSTKLSLANSIWIDHSLNVYDSFLSVNRETYGAEIFSADFSSEHTRTNINKWASDKTNGMIPEILKGMPAGQLCLMNALYFNGQWAEKFDKTLTSEGDFNNADGTVGHPMMMKAPEYSFRGCYDDRGATWVEFGYGNGAYRLLLVLPDENVSLSEYIASLSKEDLQEYNSGIPLQGSEGSISFPKFTMESELELRDILHQLGIEKVFVRDVADFSLMTAQKISVNSVKQATKVKFDEDGTEAAAVTIVMGSTSPGPLLTRNLVFDRPFAFMIKEHSTKAILFMGCVNKL